MSSIVALTDPRVPLPPVELLPAGGNEAALLTGGMALLDLPRRLGLWSPGCSVVDIGCGDGRLAYGLLQKRQWAPYFGMDVATDRLGWLRANLLPWLPDGSEIVEMPAAEGGDALPWPTWQPGLVVLHDILTRSLPDQVASLLARLGQCLPVGAAACVSLRLLNQESRDLDMRRRSAARFARPAGGTDQQPEPSGPVEAVAHDEGWFHAQVGDSGLRVETICYGGWCGRRGAFTHHDLAVLRRA